MVVDYYRDIQYKINLTSEHEINNDKKALTVYPTEGDAIIILNDIFHTWNTNIWHVWENSFIVTRFITTDDLLDKMRWSVV